MPRSKNQGADTGVDCLGFNSGDNWTLYHGDCCEVLPCLPDESIGFSVFSPPFSNLYCYSDSPKDMGNCDSYEQFADHFLFVIRELYRLIKPGRLVAIHCFQIPLMKGRDGVFGLKDFRGDIIRWFQGEGFIYHSEVCIWKCPVLQMQRTKSLGLLHKQLVKDSSLSRMGLPDYVVAMRKPGDNQDPIAGGIEEFYGVPFEAKGVSDYQGRTSPSNPSIDAWQRYASPVWDDIRTSDTLNERMARDEADERHIAPLQLDVIARCLQLWSNPGDVVLSPFAGIGSEGVGSLRLGRKFVGVELKESYFEWACKYLQQTEADMMQEELF